MICHFNMTEEINFKAICSLATRVMDIPDGSLSMKSRERRLQVTRSIAGYIALTEEDIDSCCLNDGYEITDDKAIKISERLETLNDSGETKQYEDALRENYFDGNCPFDTDFVMSFAKFCKESGGFTVC